MYRRCWGLKLVKRLQISQHQVLAVLVHRLRSVTKSPEDEKSISSKFRKVKLSQSCRKAP